jgi:hypothetical protein
MNIRTPARAATILLAVALAGLAPVAAQAETAADDSWQFQATLYGWFPSIEGTTAFPTGGSGSGSVDSDQIIDSLKMAFMGTFGAKKGKWGVWTDLLYADIGGDKHATLDFASAPGILPIGAVADLSLDIKSWAWTLAGTYELAKTPKYTADLVFGARLLDVEQTLDWTLTGTGPLGLSPSGSKTVDADNWDAIIGVKGVAYLGTEHKWFIPYYADVGTGQSDLTWQVNAGIGYRYSWGALVASWRYMDYEFKSGEPIQSMSLNGPLVGATFVW